MRSWRSNCGSKEEWRNHSLRSISGTEPTEFPPGQVTVIEKTRRIFVLDEREVVLEKAADGSQEVVRE